MEFRLSAGNVEDGPRWARPAVHAKRGPCNGDDNITARSYNTRPLVGRRRSRAGVVERLGKGRCPPGVCAGQRPSVKSGTVSHIDHTALTGTQQRKAVVLLSGGLDSTTALAIARSDGFEPYAMSFRYGQRHVVELESAKRIAAQMGVRKHVIVDIDLRQFGGSALTADIDVPKGRPAAEMSAGIPITYVPARNTIFLSFALGWAETLGAQDIFVGVNALDYSGYPDCRPEFIAAYERMANLATKAGVEGSQQLKIHTPLIELTKAQIIARGLALGVDYGWTSSCYDPGTHGEPCGSCDSCVLRAKGFTEVGTADPLLTRMRSA
jgi:7-cyano-7-deazaguanine synthase